MVDQLIPSRRAFDGQDPIFKLNAEAQAMASQGKPVVNATVGALLDDAGKLVVLEPVMELYSQLTGHEVAPYAPIAGDVVYLTSLTHRHWPELGGYGVGCATPGGTGALALSIKNLLEPGMSLLTAAPFWGPYATLAQENGVNLRTVPYPEPGQRLDVATWKGTAQVLLEQQGRLLLWLNDPCHNPTGRSLAREDRRALLQALRELAPLGPITLLLDFAYLDYAKDKAAVTEALADYRAFGEGGSISTSTGEWEHRPGDGAIDGGPVLVAASLSLSKALTLYGARAGALVFPWCKDETLQAALSISCRGTYSNCARAPMSLLLRLEKDPAAQARLAAQQAHWAEVLRQRAEALDAALRAEGLEGAPWEGGFFVTLAVEEPFAVCERLKGHGVFVVPMPEGLRVGICGMKAADAGRFAQALKASL
ncbi:MAG TPA: aminotransferase class I/II-fold pyridoxal phosphate-dependent enzyme [Holophagaceae bacterium]|nr:aminotransferase class I/II-fold pyridoxal phosphate-dependent enzyme [Holophagaceae bacterium]